MKVLSFTHTLACPAGDVHFRTDAKTTPEQNAVIVYNRVRTVVEMNDEEAHRLIADGLVAEWLPEVHGATAAAIAGHMDQPREAAVSSRPSMNRG